MQLVDTCEEWYCRQMAFEPDIIVTESEDSEIALVVEVKTAIHDFERTERELKEYMVGRRCPIGILVSPERLWLYRDRYLSSSADSVVKVTEFDVSGLLRFAPSGSGRNSALAFETEVQSWLESLSTEASLRELPAEARSAVELCIVPAISRGLVRAGHPRSSLSA